MDGQVMRRILVVSPHFPPTSAADMHRVRQSLQYFPEFGWQPSVLAVEPGFVEGQNEPLLLQTVPADIDVTRVRALPANLTRKVGLGDLALRSIPFLYRPGGRIIR